jgi:L-2-hydroxyglutarate oxidase LhgO
MTSELDHFDICIVGAGVVGLAIACQLSRHPLLRKHSLVILERESGFGQHTSSRNSEVIHAGIYYPQHSLKARLCVRGKHLLYEHCSRHDVAFQRTGKLIVAQTTQAGELEQIADKAAANGVEDLRWLDFRALQELEPAVRGHTALLSPSTGIIDSHRYMESLLHLAQQAGAHYAPYTVVDAVEPTATAYQVQCRIGGNTEQESYRFTADSLINCAGLEAQSLASRIAGLPATCIPSLYLCKGDYFSYTGRSPFRHLIYPVPEKHITGLGIHGTLDLSGQLRFGPDANYVETLNYTIDPHKNIHFAQAIAQYFPDINANRLVPAYAGIRPKLVPAGAAAADFSIQEYSAVKLPGLIQLFGIESPGLTASLAIGEHVAELVCDYLG